MTEKLKLNPDVQAYLERLKNSGLPSFDTMLPAEARKLYHDLHFYVTPEPTAVTESTDHNRG